MDDPGQECATENAYPKKGYRNLVWEELGVIVNKGQSDKCPGKETGCQAKVGETIRR